MTFLSAWAVDGSKVPASMARRVAWATSSGASGIVNAGDLRVTALPTPGGSIRIMPGTAIVENTYPSVTGQSYVVANDAAFDLAVPATGSGSGATRYVIVRVDDPEFGGQTPAEPLTAAYCSPELVSSITGLNYPFVVLAKIVQPVSTATITQGLIADLRELANPRSLYVQRAYNIISGQEETLTSTSTDGEWYPNAGAQDSSRGGTVFIPEWATSVSIIATWAAVRYRGGNTYGRAWLAFGPVSGAVHDFNTQDISFDSDGSAGSQRVNWICTDTLDVASSIRGTSQPFVFKARLIGGTGDARPYMDAISGVSLQLQFLEQATQDN